MNIGAKHCLLNVPGATLDYSGGLWAEEIASCRTFLKSYEKSDFMKIGSSCRAFWRAPGGPGAHDVLFLI